jgi:hypothetical protein
MRLAAILCGLVLALSAGAPDAAAAPLMQAEVAPQRIVLKARKVKGTGVVLKDGLKAGVLAGTGLTWEYVPGTSVSVPYLTIQLQRVEVGKGISVLAESSGTLPSDPKNGFTLRVPLLKKESRILFTILDAEGQFEEWEVDVSLNLVESAIFVDESCADYAFKLREERRTPEPNLFFLGCRPGAGPRDLSLEILWSDLARVDYEGRTVTADSAILTLPLQSRFRSESRFTGVDRRGRRSVYSIEYEPYVLPPYEAWAGLAFFRTNFRQSNYPSEYTGIASAFLGQFWYRPEDVPLSIMVRGFGTLAGFSQSFDPVQTHDESVKTYFVDGELRYRVLERGGWRIDPLLGGWVFFMKVQSRRFGVQRIIDPVFGAVVQRRIFARDSLGLTLRLAPLQSFFNPFAFSPNEAYMEFELTYIRPFQRRNRFFATLYMGVLNFTPESLAVTQGRYLVLGGGYGW